MQAFVNQYIKIVAILFCITITSSCTIKYSTSGASIPPTAQTFSVQYFPNRAPLVNPNLSQVFTEAMKDRMLNNTRLDIVPRNGHLNFEGEITGYSTQPVNIQSDDMAASMRLTVTVRVKFTSAKDPKQNFDQSFSRYADYSRTQQLADVENTLIEDIVEQLTEDIFNKAVANW